MRQAQQILNRSDGLLAGVSKFVRCLQVPGLVEKRPNLIIGDVVYLRQAFMSRNHQWCLCPFNVASGHSCFVQASALCIRHVLCTLCCNASYHMEGVSPLASRWVMQWTDT